MAKSLAVAAADRYTRTLPFQSVQLAETNRLVLSFCSLQPQLFSFRRTIFRLNLIQLVNEVELKLKRPISYSPLTFKVSTLLESPLCKADEV